MKKNSFPFKTIINDLKLFMLDRFNLHEDEASEKATKTDIIDDVVFRGAHLWILIFAILICSVGLDINSTAVVIGAMLISPLMGPIMGVGLGIAIYDFELILLALRNIAFAALISVTTSALYFWISPLDVAQSELLARTSPTLWDVFIALFGGLVGIIASSRKEKSNAIPGVAIATALMPPLCTAGFGIASGQWNFFWGAAYLFFINSVFITIGTYLIVLLLGYSKKEFLDPAREKRVKRYIFIFVLAVILPSIYTAYNVVQKTIFFRNANSFIQTEMAFEKTRIIKTNLVFEKDKKLIEVTLFGEIIEEEKIEDLKNRLAQHNLIDTELIVQQGYIKEQEIDIAAMSLQLRTGIIENLYQENQATLQDKDKRIKLLESELVKIRSKEIPISDLSKEVKTINGNIREFSLSTTVLSDLDSMTFDTLVLAYVAFKKQPKKKENEQLEDWLKARLKVEKIKLVAN